MEHLKTRRLKESDRKWVEQVVADEWGTTEMISRGRRFDIAEQAGFVAELDRVKAGLVTYEVVNGECEIGGLLSVSRGKGVGTALLKAVKESAGGSGCRRMWLITTNDNVDALRFYQLRGFQLVTVHRGAVDETRRTLKPEIPFTGKYGIPLRDEIELEIRL